MTTSLISWRASCHGLCEYPGTRCPQPQNFFAVPPGHEMWLLSFGQSPPEDQTLRKTRGLMLLSLYLQHLQYLMWTGAWNKKQTLTSLRRCGEVSHSCLAPAMSQALVGAAAQQWPTHRQSLCPRGAQGSFSEENTQQEGVPRVSGADKYSWVKLWIKGFCEITSWIQSQKIGIEKHLTN